VLPVCGTLRHRMCFWSLWLPMQSLSAQLSLVCFPQLSVRFFFTCTFIVSRGHASPRG
jgi:hypothetical protein